MSGINEIPTLSLAFLGDAVLELFVREKLVELGFSVGKLNELKVKYVSATSQAAAVKELMTVFTEQEQDVFSRGRNAKTNSGAKNAKLADYKQATGLEAVFGYLHITGNTKREQELFTLFWNAIS
jgi:Uncharacterized protein conserved in bacteria